MQDVLWDNEKVTELMAVLDDPTSQESLELAAAQEKSLERSQQILDDAIASQRLTEANLFTPYF